MDSKQFHIDSEVEIDIAQPDDRLDGTVLKAVLIKKKGFYPALLPPWISVDHSAELWGMIFRKLDSRELRQNLGLVCKEWHDIIQNDPLFSSELKIKKENKTEKLELTTENINSILGSFPLLKKLEFYECENLILKDLDFKQCPNLEKVIYHISEFDSHLNCTVFKGSECTSFPFLHTVHEISFHPKEDLEALNIANIQSLEILSVTQPRQPFSIRQLDQFDFKTLGINLENNLETFVIHIGEEDEEDLEEFQTVAFRQLLTRTPKLKTLVIRLSGSGFNRDIDPTIILSDILQSCSLCSYITKFEFKPLHQSFHHGEGNIIKYIDN